MICGAEVRGQAEVDAGRRRPPRAEVGERVERRRRQIVAEVVAAVVAVERVGIVVGHAGPRKLSSVSPSRRIRL